MHSLVLECLTLHWEIEAIWLYFRWYIGLSKKVILKFLNFWFKYSHWML
jgi:hypothetical protein